MAFVPTALVLKYQAAFLLLSIFSSPPCPNWAQAPLLLGASGSCEEAQEGPVAPAQPHTSRQIVPRGDDCTLSTARLSSPCAEGQLSLLLLQNAKEKQRTAPLTDLFYFTYTYIFPPSKIPLAALIKPPQEKKQNQKQK